MGEQPFSLQNDPPVNQFFRAQATVTLADAGQTAFGVAHRWAAFERISELSTTHNATADYPDTFIAVGDADPFDSQSYELADTLDDLGVPVVTNFWEEAGLSHEYQFDFSHPEARQTFDDTLSFLSERFQ